MIHVCLHILSSLPHHHPSSLCRHYWDYTREGGSDIAWYNSPVFGDQWFGTNSPNNADHVVDTGRFAYTQVSVCTCQGNKKTPKTQTIDSVPR